AELVVVDGVGFPDLLASAEPDFQVVGRDDGDTAVILYIAGTAGHPKGAEFTHGSLISNTEVSRADIVRAGPDDVIFGGLPLFHVFGQNLALNVAVAAGACLTLLPRFDAAHALQIVAGHHVTVFEGVPTMYVALLHLPGRDDYDTSALRMCISGGAALPVEVLRGFEEAFGVPMLEGYGLSETSPVASFNHPGRVHKPGSIGTPIRDVEMRAGDEAGKEGPQGEVGGGAPHPRAEREEGLLGAARGHKGSPAVGLVPHRRPGPGGRGRVLLHRRPEERLDHPGRLQRVPARDRGGALRASRGGRGRGDRPAPSGPGRRSRGRGGAQARRGDQRRGAAGLRQGPGGGLQVPAAPVAGRRAAQGRDRQDPETGHSHPGRPDHAVRRPGGGCPCPVRLSAVSKSSCRAGGAGRCSTPGRRSRSGNDAGGRLRLGAGGGSRAGQDGGRSCRLVTPHRAAGWAAGIHTSGSSSSTIIISRPSGTASCPAVSQPRPASARQVLISENSGSRASSSQARSTSAPAAARSLAAAGTASDSGSPGGIPPRNWGRARPAVCRARLTS